MKLLLLLIIALGGATALGMYALEAPGYAVFTVPFGGEAYHVSMPLALLILLLLITFAALYLLCNFIVGVVRMPNKIAVWRQGRKEISAQQHTMKGFAGLIEGDWAGAEGNLMLRLDYNNASLMNYLGAAYAAQQQGKIIRRNNHLEQALEQHPKQQLAIKLTWARMQVQLGEWAEARHQLELLRLSAPTNVAVARLLAEVYQTLGDWSALVHLLPALGKMKAFSPQQLAATEKLALSNHLEAPALLQGDGNRLEQTFKALPSNNQKTATAIASYAKQLMRLGEGASAETVMRKTLNRGWDAELAGLYGMAETTDTESQIKLLQGWGKGHEDAPELLLSLARLYRRDAGFALAKDYYAKVVAATNAPEVIAELGELLEQMGDQDNALLAYKQGLKRVTTSATTQLETVVSACRNTTPAESTRHTVEATGSMPVVTEVKPA